MSSLLGARPPFAESCPETLDDVEVAWLRESPDTAAPAEVLLADNTLAVVINKEVVAHIVDDRQQIIRDCIEQGVAFTARGAPYGTIRPVVRIVRR